MSRFLLSILFAFAPFVLCPLGLAQDAEKAPAKPKNRILNYADPGKKAAVGVEVVPRPRELAILKEWKLNMPGPTTKGVTVYVTDIQLWSDGSMKFLLSFWNRSNEGQLFFFDFEEMTVADADSNPFQQLARNIVSGNRGSIYMRVIPRDQRFNTWVTYKAPEVPTTTFKIAVMLEGRRDHQMDAFKPFLITLQEPLFLSNGVFQVENGVKAAEPLPGEEAGPRPAVAGGAIGPMPKGGRSATASSTPPGGSSLRSLEETLAKFRELSENGIRFDGSIRTSKGDNGSCRMVFSKTPRSELVKAKLVITTKSIADLIPEMELTGAFLESDSAPSGIALKMIDKEQIVYTFVMDGNNISGKDTLGNQYNFVIPRK
jgi:hypothetical protein